MNIKSKYPYDKKFNKMTVGLLLVVLLLGIVLMFKGGEIATGFAIVQNNTTSVSGDILNPSPVVSNVSAFDSACCPAGTTDTTIDLVGGGTRPVYCSGDVTDLNGAGDIDTVNSTLVCTGACEGNTGTAWTAHNLKSYLNNSCEKTTINSTSAWALCRFDVAFNAQNTTNGGEWTCTIYANDTGANSTDSSSTDTINISSLVAVGTEDGTLAFGTVAASALSSKVDTEVIENYGNVRIDVMLNGTALTCDSGTIAVGNMGYNCTDPGTTTTLFPNVTALSGTVTSGGGCASLDFAHDTSATATVTTKNVYWYLNASIVGNPRGNCAGTVQYTGIEG